MTTATPPAPSAQVLFFSRLQPLQPRARTGRISTWPFKVAREMGSADDDDGNEMDDVRVQAARVIRTTAEHWWPSAS
ncbi:hypothetical protein ACGLHS_04120 [Variovorax sp. VaC1]|uniref:hypothetical protein n=1 Tax=Variovorax sp. VaC1 TaxID=3373132 RepID=UPI0037496BA8